MAGLDWLTARPIAHRGLHDGNKLCWENTATAFERAIAGGFSIECDVHLTKDGVPVVFHDDDIARLTGRTGFVHAMTAAELCALPVGGTSDRPQTLEAMLSQVAGRTPLVIELKGIQGKDEGLVAAVGRLLKAYPGPAAIMSFDHWLVRQFRHLAPGIPAGLTAYGSQPADLEAHFAMLAHHPDFCSFHVDELPNPFVAFMRETLKRPVITWTVRTRKQVALTLAHADQMTFECFDPAIGPAA